MSSMDPGLAKKGNQSHWLERVLAYLAQAAFGRPWLTLGLCLLLTILMGFPVRSLDLDADMTALLPKDAESVKNLDGVAERFGGLGHLVIVGMNAEPEALRRFVDDLVPRLQSLEDVRYVDHKSPVDFFRDRALYFADSKDLIELEQRIRDRIRWEKKDRNPLFVSLEETKPPSLDFSDLRARMDARADIDLLSVAEGEGYFLYPKTRRVLLMVKPSFLAADMDRSLKLIEQVEEIIGDMDLSAYGPDMQVGLTGRYKKRPELQAHMTANLQRSSYLALGLMLLVLVFHFRRFAAVFLVIFPLALSLVWTLGLASLCFGQLNILTGLVAAILLGLGIDHGIHLLGRYESERGRVEAGEALGLTFMHTGRAVVVAGLTTLAAFVAISLSDFRAFHEFGLVAAFGISLAVFAFTFVLPAMLGLAEGFGWRPRKLSLAQSGSPLLSAGPARLILFALVSIVLAAPFFFVTGLRFDYDFGSMEAPSLPSYRLDREVNGLLGFSEAPLVVLADNTEQEERVTQSLRERKRAAGADSTIKLVLSASRLVPAAQGEKAELLTDLQRTLKKVRKDGLSREMLSDLSRLEQMASARPFGRQDLPPEVLRQFGLGAEDPSKGAVLIYPAISTRDGRAVRRFAREVSDLRLTDGGQVAVAGEAMILAELLELLIEEAPPLVLLTLALVFLTLWLLLGRLRDALLSLLPAAITLVAVCGLLPLAHVKVTYLSIIFFLVLLGISVDGGVHLVTRLRDNPNDPAAFLDSGRAVSGAILTSALAFGTLFFADHQGLFSVAQLMIMGLMVNVLACLVILPGILRRGIVGTGTVSVT
ncbi:MAG: MMPL family transporter [Deltaproteobacteria bacterium]|nr:MMPL family transporter [Deltaproteobacteria bacterium]